MQRNRQKTVRYERRSNERRKNQSRDSDALPSCNRHALHVVPPTFRCILRLLGLSFGSERGSRCHERNKSVNQQLRCLWFGEERRETEDGKHRTPLDVSRSEDDTIRSCVRRILSTQWPHWDVRRLPVGRRRRSSPAQDKVRRQIELLNAGVASLRYTAGRKSTSS